MLVTRRPGAAEQGSGVQCQLDYPKNNEKSGSVAKSVASRISCKLLFSGFVPFLDSKIALPNLRMEAGAP